MTTADEYDYIGGSVKRASPLWGPVAEDENGRILLPAWWWVQRQHRNDSPCWWNRRLNRRNPLHWLSWLRLRLTNRVVMVEEL